MMLEVGRAFAFTDGNQQHTPIETHVTTMQILKLETENCQAVGVTEEVVNYHTLPISVSNDARAF
jgi:hypothetical protein